MKIGSYVFICLKRVHHRLYVPYQSEHLTRLDRIKVYSYYDGMECVIHICLRGMSVSNMQPQSSQAR